MIALTLFDLVVRSMRKNIKHYYLYFFALILSVVLYFVFATLQHDAAVVTQTELSMKMESSFKAAGILLLFITSIFVVYANAIFLRRRSREIGLYQLIGLTKGAVARLLIIENSLLSAGALMIGIGLGMLVSRLFLLLLLKLVGFKGFIEVSFSLGAALQTALVFLAITVLTSVQMLFKVYRHTLLSLFHAESKGEIPKKPRGLLSASLAILGVGLILFGYWLSGRMLNPLLFLNMLAVLASTILGTYLLFRVTISWVLYFIRNRQNGHLGLNRSLSLASLMHHMKGNANSLTIITVLSAMTMTMLAGTYSLFYATEKEARFLMPYDFMFEQATDVQWFTQELKQQNIAYQSTPIEVLQVDGQFVENAVAKWFPSLFRATIVSEQALHTAGIHVQVPKGETGVLHDVMIYWALQTMDLPLEVKLTIPQKERLITIAKIGEGNVLNAPMQGGQIVVQPTTYEELKRYFLEAGEGAHVREIVAVQIVDTDQLAQASALYHNAEEIPGLKLDFYTEYENGIENNGLLIFITGFLGLVFLISTGSILYFKQMTEAEQEKRSYVTLRQLGFSVQEIMQGIVRKQLFVFGLPLAIGILHSIFAIQSASFLFMSDITVPTVIAMSVYALIYFVFALLTIGYYRKIVQSALR